MHTGTAKLILVLPALAILANSARAEDTPPETTIESNWAFSCVFLGSAIISNDQLRRLDLEGGGGGHLAVRVRPLGDAGVDWIEGELRAGIMVVGPGYDAPGGLIDVQLGMRVAPRLGDTRPYLALGVGFGRTGAVLRPVGSAALGIAFQLIDELALGPEISLVHVIQHDGPGQSDDAVFLQAGLALTFRPVTRIRPEEPAPEPEPVTPGPDTPEPFVPPPLPPTPPSEELLRLIERAVPGTQLEVVLLVPPVLFDHDESTLTALGEVSMHDVLARISEAPSSARIVIEGHADATGDPARNEALSRERAHVVSAWLVTHGVPRTRIVEIGRGASAPLVPGTGRETLAPNRRVTIRIEMDSTPEAAQ